MESEKGSWKVLNLLFLDTGNVLVWGQRSVSNEKWARRLWCSGLRKADFCKLWLFWGMKLLIPGANAASRFDSGRVKDAPASEFLTQSPLGRCWSIVDMTRSRLMSWFQSRKWVKVKVVKLCFKKWNGHILMHIYHIQCEFIQKNQWKGSNGQIHCFCKGNQLRGAKKLEN